MGGCIHAQAIPITTVLYVLLGDPLSTIRHPELQTAPAVCVMKDPPEQRNKPLAIEKPKSRYETQITINTTNSLLSPSFTF